MVSFHDSVIPNCSIVCGVVLCCSRCKAYLRFQYLPKHSNSPIPTLRWDGLSLGQGDHFRGGIGQIFLLDYTLFGVAFIVGHCVHCYYNTYRPGKAFYICSNGFSHKTVSVSCFFGVCGYKRFVRPLSMECMSMIQLARSAVGSFIQL